VLSKIATLPPLVAPSEASSQSQNIAGIGLKRRWQIERLRYQLSQVQENKGFLLHAGDCAESFDACTHVCPSSASDKGPHE